MANPFNLEVEEDYSPHLQIIKAKATLLEAGGVDPTTIIRTNQDWKVQFEWETLGSACHHMAGKWVLEVLLEKWGPGEIDLLNNTKEVDIKSEPASYNAEINFQAGKVDKGKYKLIVSVTTVGPNGVPGAIALTGEGPLITFFESPH